MVFLKKCQTMLYSQVWQLDRKKQIDPGVRRPEKGCFARCREVVIFPIESPLRLRLGNNLAVRSEVKGFMKRIRQIRPHVERGKSLTRYNFHIHISKRADDSFRSKAFCQLRLRNPKNNWRNKADLKICIGAFHNGFVIGDIRSIYSAGIPSVFSAIGLW